MALQMGFGIPTPNPYDYLVGDFDLDGSDGGGGSGDPLLETEYALRFEEGATYTYIGEADPGSTESAAVWRIKRMTNADTTIVWADGTAEFDKVWDDYLTYSYL